MKRIAAALLLVLFFQAAAHAGKKEKKDEVQLSTTPIGSAFYRHLAHDRNIDLHELEKFERKGFGRAEIVTLVLISTATGKPLKEYGNRRLKDKVLLRDLAKESGLDYQTLFQKARAIKEEIEARGDKNLPPPVFEKVPKDNEIPEKKIDKQTLNE